MAIIVLANRLDRGDCLALGAISQQALSAGQEVAKAGTVGNHWKDSANITPY
jgi:hypothetical protein